MKTRSLLTGERDMQTSCLDSDADFNAKNQQVTRKTDHGDLSYVLDADNRICRTKGPWDGFVLANLGPGGEGMEALAENVIGLSLNDFVQDEPTRMLLSALADSVRLLRWERHLDYRCDSPTMKRFMQMKLEPGPLDTVILTHKLLRTEPIQPAFYVLTASSGETARGRRCSLCNKVRIGDAWVEPDHNLAQRVPQPYAIKHTLCPICQHAIK